MPPVTAKAPGSPDALYLPGGQVGQLRKIPADAFDRLPFGGLPDLPNDSTSEHLPAEQGRVTRQGWSLLRPAQVTEVRLAPTPDAQFTLQNAKGVKYQYWSSLPAAHQWVVRAWYWESDGTVLVDQRTGRQVGLVPPRGLARWPPSAAHQPRTGRRRPTQQAEPGASGSHRGAPAVADGTHHLGAGRSPLGRPYRVVLMRRHALPDGSMANDAPVTYDELTLPR
ncbi:hypothetical protein [Hymenobacter negativus]|uniref:DUF4178 domain-containing protein n=1 Tax=Hymenobacter negativus TaxID=2795026 RepID=A0ABS3QNY8_9BACT|nr:hypothetical protein [Hymenobacter negativus]MBO2012956.1 hypothetical protein [Hymenobacter negativus]